MSSRILWRRIDQPGHEHAVLARNESGWVLQGVALFAHESAPCRLEYEVQCDDDWVSLSAVVWGHVGGRKIDAAVHSRAGGVWELNGQRAPAVHGCVDVDLNFSPSTNLLPVRRLNLAVGEQATVRAAWLRFPSFGLEPLEQIYMRTGQRTYRYTSGGGSFSADIEVDEDGLAVRYADLWVAEATAR